MSELAQVNVKHLCPADDETGPFVGPMGPGTWVSHISDSNSWGMIVARIGDDTSVLWSKSPSYHYPFSPRKGVFTRKVVTAKWEAQIIEDLNVFNSIDAGYAPQRMTYIGQETYRVSSLTLDELEQLSNESLRVIHHSDGSIEVERRAESLPDYVNPEDVRVTYRRY